MSYVKSTILLGFLSIAITACEAPPKPVDEALDVPQTASTELTRTGNLEQNFQMESRSLSFANGKYSGNTGCNNFNGTYQLVGNDRVIVGPMVMTRMACPNKPRLMEEEANFGKNFPGEYRIVSQGGTMILMNDQRSWVLGQSVN